MIKLVYAPAFVRQFQKLENNLQEEILEKIELFKNSKNHKLLKVHKLHGVLKNEFSFSVNYRTRIIFGYSSKEEVNIFSVGDHSIYN